MVLVPGRRAGQGRGLLAERRRAFPGILRAGPSHHLGVGVGSGEVAETVVQQRRGRLRLNQGQDRDREGLDVPHHVAVIVVIVVPGGQTKDRSRGARRGVDRAVEIEERRVGQGLPARLGAEQLDPPFPQLVPRGAVLGPDDLESVVARLGGHAARLLVGPAVQGAGHEAGDLAQAIGRSGAGPESVGRDQSRGIERWPQRLGLRAGPARHLREIGHAHAPQRPRRLPEQNAVAGGRRLARRIAQEPQGSSQHAGDRDAGADLQLAGAVHRQGDFLADQGRILAAGEGQHRAADPPLASGEHEPASQFTRSEVVGLFQVADLMQLVRKPNAIDGDVAGQRIGRRRGRLDAALWILAGIAADQGHAGLQRLGADAQADQAVADIGGQIAVPLPGHGRWADGSRHVISCWLTVSSKTPTRREGSRTSTRRRALPCTSPGRRPSWDSWTAGLRSSPARIPASVRGSPRNWRARARTSP
jgi:hypothetical protein